MHLFLTFSMLKIRRSKTNGKNGGIKPVWSIRQLIGYFSFREFEYVLYQISKYNWCHILSKFDLSQVVSYHYSGKGRKYHGQKRSSSRNLLKSSQQMVFLCGSTFEAITSSLRLNQKNCCRFILYNFDNILCFWEFIFTVLIVRVRACKTLAKQITGI